VGDPLAFSDTDASVFVDDIAWLSATGITKGCTDTTFCPDASVTRGQMAAFLVRALDLPPSDEQPFTDVEGIFEGDIAALAAAGVTSGCTEARFCPNDVVTRAQIASFLTRGLGLDPITPPPATGTGGCGGAIPSEGEHSITVDDETRLYLLDLPADYDDREPLPIVFGFHGLGGSAEGFRSYGRLVDAVGNAAIVVHPNSGASKGWDSPLDVDFFDATLADVSASACVDADRIFATGHSYGGFMSNRLGCQRGDVLAGIGPVAGGGPYDGTCDGPVPAVIIHGDPDPVVAFATGVASRDRWLNENGCSTAAAPLGDGGMEYTDCSSGAHIQWWVHDQGHAWPDFAETVVWEFFSDL
jgi:poly(3-hydroxybutyrate) depolymerase